ncbi:VWA domain-containing protein [Methyloceanibacter methanicus]|nr:VWA domain-containing protein [Methyloceanibacter methanicus]
MGRFSDGKFDFIVVADHVLGETARQQWMDKFVEASRRLFDATEGQISFGNIYIGDNSFGLGAAEAVLHDINGRAFATIGGFGQPGHRFHLFSNSTPNTIVHEFAHHAFALHDEYLKVLGVDSIDRDATPPDGYALDPPFYDQVPLITSELPPQDLQGNRALIRFGNQLIEQFVEAHTPELLTTFNSFGADPMTQGGGRVFYHKTDGIGCADAAGAIYSIMDQSNDLAVTEFCTAANHDLSGLENAEYANRHTDEYGGLSCWEVMRDKMLERWDFPLIVPSPEAQPGAFGGYEHEDPLRHDLLSEGRFVLVMDRSGSMADAGKIVGAKYGVELWLTYMAEVGDFLSVVWYNENVDVALGLEVIADTANLQGLVAEANNVVPQGFTNIRDALYEAHQQITSREGQAALQGVVLLTDGIHNRPIDTSALEVIPTFQADQIPILAIAVGDQNDVDMETLETLSRETGGALQAAFAAVNYDASDDFSVRGSVGVLIALAHALLRDGAALFGELQIGSEDSVAAAMSKEGAQGEKLKSLAEMLGLRETSALLGRRTVPGAATVRFLVEEGANYTAFTILYREKQDVEVTLVDPDGNAVEYDGVQNILSQSPQSPLKVAIVKEPKPGLWKAVLARKTPGEPFSLFYAVEIDNERIAVRGDVDPLVPIGGTATIRASGNWQDLLSDLDVTARIVDPQGGIHMVSLSDEQYIEPNSGSYLGTFVPTMPGRHAVEITIANRGRAILAGGIHRAMHGPAPDKDKPQVIDISSAAPVFTRRIPLFFDAGVRRKPVDKDQKASGKVPFPVKPRKLKLKPVEPRKQN